MAAITSGLSHLDIRSESRSYKRDKTQKVKWTYGTRPLHGVRVALPDLSLVGDSESQREKVRPDKKAWINRTRWSERSSNTKYTKNGAKTDDDYSYTGAATGKITRKHTALEDFSTLSPASSRYLMSILPTSAAMGPEITGDAGITYSFDAKTSPRKGTALDGLVQKAEQDFLSKEVEKMVRDEYEYLDVSGESIIVGIGSSGSKKSKRQERKTKEKEQKPQLLVEDEDDWERV